MMREVSPFAKALGPDVSRGRANKAIDGAGETYAARVYRSPDGPRWFAERCILGALGKSTSWVYFIGASLGGPVKIGTARDPEQRLRELQVGNPEELAVLVALRGGADAERVLHAVFGVDHIRGEWFRRSEALASFMAEIQRRRPVTYSKGLRACRNSARDVRPRRVRTNPFEGIA